MSRSRVRGMIGLKPRDPASKVGAEGSFQGHMDRYLHQKASGEQQLQLRPERPVVAAVLKDKEAEEAEEEEKTVEQGGTNGMFGGRRGRRDALQSPQRGTACTLGRHGLMIEQNRHGAMAVIRTRQATKEERRSAAGNLDSMVRGLKACYDGEATFFTPLQIPNDHDWMAQRAEQVSNTPTRRSV